MTQTTATGNTPKVTVILPTYNRAAYLTQAIDSIRAQTLKDWELIIVDDASSDNTPEVVRAFTQQDKRIRYHRLDTNQGAAGCRNTGLKHARGTYIAFQDDDDMSHPERLQRQVEDLKTRPRYAFSRTWVTKFYTNTPYKWGRQKQIVKTVGHLVTTMAPRHLLQHVPYRPFFPTLEDHDHRKRLEEYCSRHNKKTDAKLFAPVLPHVLYAVREAQQTTRVGQHPLYDIYFLFIELSALHRQHGLPDPIDNAHTIEDAIHNLQFANMVPPLITTITDLIDTCIVYALTDKNDTLKNHAEQLAQKCFHQSLGDYISSHIMSSAVIKSHLHQSIRHHKRASYLAILRAIHQFNPHTLRVIAIKIVFACLKRGRFSFIFPLIKTLLRIKK